MACGVDQIMIALTMTGGELILVFIGKWYEKKMNRIFPFHLKVEGESSEDMHDIFKFIKGEHDYARFSIATMNITVNYETNLVIGDFYVEGRFHESNAEHAFKLIKDINEKYPKIKSISFKRNG
jgi:hypothetical protein